MANPKRINLKQLRQIINELLEHAERVNGPEVLLDNEYFWEISSSQLYDMSKPVECVEGVGSLSENLELLYRLHSIRDQGPSLMLANAAPLLRYIGEKVRE